MTPKTRNRARLDSYNQSNVPEGSIKGPETFPSEENNQTYDFERMQSSFPASNNKSATEKDKKPPLPRGPPQNLHDARPQTHHHCVESTITDVVLSPSASNLAVARAAYQPGLLWEQQPFFVLLTQAHGPPGSAIEYEVPSPEGFGGPQDKTTFVYGYRQPFRERSTFADKAYRQAGMTVDFWPVIMYLLRPPKEFLTYVGEKKGAKRDYAGNVVYEKWPVPNKRPRPLRDLPGVPDQISTREDWWKIEFWRRLSGCQWRDLQMRMMPEGGVRDKRADGNKRNSLNMLGSRTYYPHYKMAAWYYRVGAKSHFRRILMESQLGDWQLTNNSTRGLTPGLIEEKLGESNRNRVSVPPLSDKSGRRLPGGRKRKAQEDHTDTDHEDHEEKDEKLSKRSKSDTKGTKFDTRQSQSQTLLPSIQPRPSHLMQPPRRPTFLQSSNEVSNAGPYHYPPISTPYYQQSLHGGYSHPAQAFPDPFNMDPYHTIRNTLAPHQEQLQHGFQTNQTRRAANPATPFGLPQDYHLNSTFDTTFGDSRYGGMPDYYDDENRDISNSFLGF